MFIDNCFHLLQWQPASCKKLVKANQDGDNISQTNQFLIFVVKVLYLHTKIARPDHKDQEGSQQWHHKSLSFYFSHHIGNRFFLFYYTFLVTYWGLKPQNINSILYPEDTAELTIKLTLTYFKEAKLCAVKANILNIIWHSSLKTSSNFPSALFHFYFP